MGAFFFFKSDDKLDIDAVRNVFNEKGFSAPAQFTLNDMTLWLYKKQLVDEDNYYFTENGSAIFASGTLIYKGKSYIDTLRCLIWDFERDQVDLNDIIGAFSIILLKDGKLYVLTDRSDMCHIYINREQTIVTSSFLAMIAAQTQRLSLNRMACLEQLMIGYTVAPDTIIKEISILTESMKKAHNGSSYSFIVYPESPACRNNSNCEDFNGCVHYQLKSLNDYFQQIAPLAKDYGVDIGLSGGYDSRLNLLLTSRLPAKISGHTHSSAGHRTEQKIAEAITAKKNISLRSIHINNPTEITEEQLMANLSDSFYFYDGRTNKTMGTYNDVHTRKYRIAILDKNKLGLNGLGGELFRNHDHTYIGKINFGEWIKYYLMDLYAVSSLNKKELRSFLEYVIFKYSEILDMRPAKYKYIDRFATRRFYASVWFPYSAGIKSQAENQLAFFLMPFCEYTIRNKALQATPFIGVNGKFESAMMMELDREVAGIPSSYGFAFGKEPALHMIKSLFKCCMPERIKNGVGLARLKLSKRTDSDYVNSISAHPMLQQIIALLRDLRLPISWEDLFLSRVHFERAISTGYLLYKYSGKISFANK